MDAAAGDLRELQRLVMEYWGQIVTGTGNIAYQLAYNSLDATYLSIEAELTFVLAAELNCLDEYKRLKYCISQGDATGAAETARGIVHRGQRALSSILEALDREQGVSS
jgi:DNA-binding FadR family transcriptional regulator